MSRILWGWGESSVRVPKGGLLQMVWVTCSAKITLGLGLQLSLPPSPSCSPAKAKARNNPSQSPGCCCAITSNSKSSVTITQEKKQKEKGVWETREVSMYAMWGPTQDLTGRVCVHCPSLRQRDPRAQSTLRALWGSAVLQTRWEDPPPGTILQEAGPCMCPSC